MKICTSNSIHLWVIRIHTRTPLETRRFLLLTVSSRHQQGVPSLLSLASLPLQRNGVECSLARLPGVQRTRVDCIQTIVRPHRLHGVMRNDWLLQNPNHIARRTKNTINPTRPIYWLYDVWTFKMLLLWQLCEKQYSSLTVLKFVLKTRQNWP